LKSIRVIFRVTMYNAWHVLITTTAMHSG